jgi:hypothetical protein
MLKSTLDNLICEEISGLCSIIRKEFNDPETTEYPDVIILNIVTRLEQLLEDRKNAR